jgi:hypothetical protein
LNPIILGIVTGKKNQVFNMSDIAVSIEALPTPAVVEPATIEALPAIPVVEPVSFQAMEYLRIVSLPREIKTETEVGDAIAEI